MRKHILQGGAKIAESAPAPLSTPPITKEQLQQFTKEQLIELLLVALEGQKVQTQNAIKAIETARQLQAKVVQLEDEKKSLEAKVIALEARL